ncbi:MAG TPA: MFS transporter [Myxococcota bacterium]|nr:MFS transporter [Myxococcota bacterium]
MIAEPHPALPARPGPLQASPTRARQRVVAFALSMMAIAYLDRVCISTAAPSIQRDLVLSDAQMGYVFSAFTLGYALFEVPSGWLADRFGARWMLTRIVVWWSVMTAATALATGFASLLTLRLLFGMGEAGALPSTSRAFARWLPPRERGHCFGLTIMAGALGGALAQPLVVLLIGWLSWRSSFPIFGVVGLGWAFAWFSWFRDDPHTHAEVNAAELRLIGTDPPVPHPAVPWRAILQHRGLLALCLMYLGAIYGWYFYLTWLPTYLLRARGFELRSVGWRAALPLLAIAFGVYSGGWLSDLLCRRFGPTAGRRLPGLVGLPAAALCVLGAVGTPAPQTAASLLAAAAGLAALGVAPAWAVCLEIGGLHAGVVSGAMNTFGNLGGVLSPLVVGWCLEARGSWNAPLVSVACLYVLSAACWLAIDPRERLAESGSR